MRKVIEEQGKNPEKAIQKALDRLGVERSQVTVEILDHGSESSLCLRPARVRVTQGGEKKQAPEPREKPRPQRKEPEEQPSSSRSRETGRESRKRETREPNRSSRSHEERDSRREPRRRNSSRSGSSSEVERETRRTLNEILRGMDIDATLSIEKRDNKVHVSIESDDGALLIGKQGKNLDALQHIVNRIVNRSLNSRITVVLDTEEYRERHRESLETLALRIADRVRGSGRKIILKEMNPYDRRLVHMALEDDPDVETVSDGNGFFKKIRVQLYR